MKNTIKQVMEIRNVVVVFWLVGWLADFFKGGYNFDRGTVGHREN